VPVDANTLAHFTPKQLIYRHAQPLALNIPQRHLDAADGCVQHGTASPEGMTIHPLYQMDDTGGVFTQ
jgi:hypothetical protein